MFTAVHQIVHAGGEFIRQVLGHSNVYTSHHSFYIYELLITFCVFMCMVLLHVLNVLQGGLHVLLEHPVAVLLGAEVI